MTKRRRRSKKWLYWVLILILLIVAGIIGYLIWSDYSKDSKLEEEEVVEVVEQRNEEIELANEGAEKEKVPQYDGDSPNTKEELSGAVTYAGVQDKVLIIRVNIDQYLDGGECELTLKRNGDSIYGSVAKIVENVSTSTCEGFDVPTSGLGGGKAEININLKANSKKGTIRGEVNI